ncbi:hypothetical protein FE257_005945 [Aspergillus nanangensis]|uniref:Major facilitator superfamily (MFS) profile domain-containing protein n=1 Tax=Aspergillus nanangensis TaxID=2582783 RepID=A0AAD4CPW7_ASPNN|nr:hypothetical protein FE257_005945 [Aspergillus nanangensis]
MEDTLKPTITHAEDIGAKNEAINTELSSGGEQPQLQPRPSADPNDPLNWSLAEKRFTLIMAALMVFNAAFDAASPAAGFNSQAKDFGVPVPDMLSSIERGKRMGVWTLFFGISPYVSVLIDGIITTYASWQWMQWLNFILWGVLIFLCLFMQETLYHRQVGMQSIPPKDSFFQRIKLKKFDGSLTLRSFYKPLLAAWYPSIFFPTIYYGNIYGFGIFGSLGVLPFAFGEGYGFNAVGQGLVAISLLLGTICGEPLAGAFSDWIVRRAAKQLGGQRYPEQRLPAIWLGVSLTPVGLVIIGCTLHYEFHWIGPCIGMFITSFAIQIVSTVAFTYSMDCYDYAADDVSLLYTFGRQIFSFYVAFYIHPYVTRVGYAWAFGIYAIISGCLAVPLIILSFHGTRIRIRLGHTMEERPH